MTQTPRLWGSPFFQNVRYEVKIFYKVVSHGSHLGELAVFKLVLM